MIRSTYSGNVAPPALALTRTTVPALTRWANEYRPSRACVVTSSGEPSRLTSLSWVGGGVLIVVVFLSERLCALSG